MRLLHEDARGVNGNWGPPMSYAANLGRSRIIEMLRARGRAKRRTRKGCCSSSPGALIEDGHGTRLPPVGMLLETYSRNPQFVALRRRTTSRTR